MKVIQRTCAILLLLVFFVSLSPVCFADMSSGDWTYTVNEDKSITITGYMGSKKKVEIPSEIDGKAVTSIGENAFQGNTHLLMLIIPNGVKTICDGAFSDCTKLTSVIMPGTITSIGNSAFRDCSSLSGIFLPDSLEHIGEDVFQGCNNISVSCTEGTFAAEYVQENKEQFNTITIYEAEPVDVPATLPSLAPTIKDNVYHYSLGKDFDGIRQYELEISSQRGVIKLAEYDGTNYRDIIAEAENNGYTWKTSTGPLFGISDGKGNTIWTYTTGISITSDDGAVTSYSFEHDTNFAIDEYRVSDLPIMRIDCDGQLSRQEQNTFCYDILGNQTAHYFSKFASIPVVVANCDCGLSGHFEASYDSNGNVITKWSNKCLSGADYGLDIDDDVFQCNKTNQYAEDGSLLSARHYSTAPQNNSDDNYEIEHSEYEKSKSRFYSYTTQTGTESPTTVNVVESYRDHYSYEDTIVQANSTHEASDNSSHALEFFDNDAEQRTAMVSEKSIETEKIERTDTAAGASTPKNQTDYLTLEAKSHQYIGDTGKYIGWDWLWSYDADSETASLFNYSINEYKYDYDTEQWARTETQITNLSGFDLTDTVDFESTYPDVLAGNYDTISMKEYLYDSSDVTDITNWKFEGQYTLKSTAEGTAYSFYSDGNYREVINGIEYVYEYHEEDYAMHIKEIREASQERLDELANIDDTTTAIIKGETSVVDADGNEIEQQEAKEELLDKLDEMQEPEYFEVDDSYYQEVVAEMEA